MTTRPFRSVLTLCLLLAASASFAETSGNLSSIVGRHQSGAPNAELELGLVEELLELSKRGSAEWLPDFWSAYFLTQIVMSHPEEKGPRLQSAHRHLDQAFERAEVDGDAPLGDLYCLRNLIHSFEQGGAKSKEEYEALEQRATEALSKAYKADPQSPVVLVMVATGMIRNGKKEQDWPAIIAGRSTLQRAEDLFEAAAEQGEVTTHFNREWVSPWLGSTDRMLAGGFAAE